MRCCTAGSPDERSTNREEERQCQQRTKPGGTPSPRENVTSHESCVQLKALYLHVTSL